MRRKLLTLLAVLGIAASTQGMACTAAEIHKCTVQIMSDNDTRTYCNDLQGRQQRAVHFCNPNGGGAKYPITGRWIYTNGLSSDADAGGCWGYISDRYVDVR